MGGAEPGGLPSGVVTFLFTDIEDSTPLFRRLGDRYPPLLHAHSAMIRAALHRHHGVEVRTEGDSFFAVFADAADAIRAAAAAQAELEAYEWPAGARLRVRMGLHTGEAVASDGDYISLTVHEAARVLAAGHGGQVLVSRATAEAVGDRAPELHLRELGTFHIRDFRAPESLFQLAGPGLPTDFPAVRSLVVLLDNLPVPEGAMFGRAAELGRVADLVRASGRTTTITGPGGVGKSRLAVELGRRMIVDLDDGVWLVRLQDTTGGRVAEATLEQLGLRQPGADAAGALVKALAPKRLLLILDNCEHLIAGVASLVTALQTSCPGVAVVATSREPLKVPGEQVVRLGPLAVPAEDELTALASAAPAVEMFIDRMQRTGMEAPTDDAALAGVAAVCRRLDGLPLAIEVAAAQVAVVGIDGVIDEVDRRTAPTSGPGENSDRLTSLFSWSYDLLDPPAQSAFRALAVVPGAFSVDVARYLLATGGGIAQLGLLTDRSLIEADGAGPAATYRLLDLVRAFAARQTSGDEATAHRLRLLEWSTAKAAAAYTGVVGPDQRNVLRTIDNDIAALNDSLELALGRDPGALAELVIGLEQYWLRRGLLADARLWTDRAMAPDVLEAVDGARAAALHLAASNVARVMGDLAGSLELATRAESLAQIAGDAKLAGRAQYARGAAMFIMGELDAARDVLESARSWALAQGDQITLGNATVAIAGLTYRAGELALAVGGTEEAIDILAAAGDTVRMAFAINNLANIVLGLGDFDRARDLFTRAITLRTEVGDVQGVAGSVHDLGNVHLRAGEFAAAQALYDQALATARRIGDLPLVALALGSLGAVAQMRQDHEAGIAYAEQALALTPPDGDPSRAMHPLGNLVHLNLACGRQAEAERRLAQLAEVTDRLGTAPARAGLAEASARVAAFADDLAAARRHYETIIDIGDEGASLHRMMVAIENLVFLDVVTGDRGRAEERASELVRRATASPDASQQARAHAARSMVARLGGDLDESRASLMRAAACSGDETSTRIWIAEASRYLDATGHSDVASRLMASALGFDHPVDPSNPPFEAVLFQADAEIIARCAPDQCLTLEDAIDAARSALEPGAAVLPI